MRKRGRENIERGVEKERGNRELTGKVERRKEREANRERKA